MENSVTIRDNRNGKEYVLPIEEGSRERLQSQVQPLPGRDGTLGERAAHPRSGIPKYGFVQ